VLVGCCVGVGDKVKGGIKDNGGDGRQIGEYMRNCLKEVSQNCYRYCIVSHMYLHQVARRPTWLGGKRALGASITSRFPLLTYMYTSHTHTLQTAIMIRRVSRDGWMNPLGRDVKKENETWDGVVRVLVVGYELLPEERAPNGIDDGTI